MGRGRQGRKVAGMRLSVLFVMAFGACVSAAHAADASRGPGRIGVYLRLQSLAGDPDAMRRELREVRRCGVDFIVPIAKDTSGRVYWDSRLAPSELVASKTFLADITRLAHEAGLKVYPWVCVCTEGGLTAVNRVLKDHPDWATITADGSIGIIDPGNPAARKYEIRLIAEMVDTVEVDGVSLDYVRASNRFAYTPTLRSDFLRLHGTDARDILGLGAAPVGSESGGPRAGSAGHRRASILSGRRGGSGTAGIWTADAGDRRLGAQGEAGSDHRLLRLGRTHLRPDVRDVSGLKADRKGVGWTDHPSGYRYTEESFVEAARLNRASVPQSCPC